MKLIVVLDEKGGMLFNHRRQSQDALLRDRILFVTEDTPLFMNAYTARQFAVLPPCVRVSEAPMDEAGEGEYCLIENLDPTPYEHEIEELIVYRWDKVYPSDMKFCIDLDGWKLIHMDEFAGNSHEIITEEIYRR